MLKTSNPLYAPIRQLGFSPTAVNCYNSLFEEGPATALELAKRLSLQPTALYRELNKLAARGFVDGIKTKSQPTYYYARSIDKALAAHGEYLTRTLKPLFDHHKEVILRRKGHA